MHEFFLLQCFKCFSIFFILCHILKYYIPNTPLTVSLKKSSWWPWSHEYNMHSLTRRIIGFTWWLASWLKTTQFLLVQGRTEKEISGFRTPPAQKQHHYCLFINSRMLTGMSLPLLGAYKLSKLPLQAQSRANLQKLSAFPKNSANSWVGVGSAVLSALWNSSDSL